MITQLPVGDLIFLGTGTSHGVPVIGCECAVCQSANLRNRRTRSSVILGMPEGSLLIDTGPDLRAQFLRENLQKADAILYTHAHVDHLFGLDEVRIWSKYNGQRPIDVYCQADVAQNIHQAFAYVFDPIAQHFEAGGIPKLELHEIRPYQPFDVLGGPILPLAEQHGRFPILGFRIGDLAYCTDVKEFPPESEERLQGLDTLIIGCLRYSAHPTHMCLDEVLAVLERLRPRRTFFTHLCHDFEHEKLCAELPDNIRPAYDGLRLENAFRF